MSEPTMRDSTQNVVDDVRALRAEVSRETDGFERMGEHLRRIRDEYRNRSGRFAGLGTQPSESVRQAIASAADEDSGNAVTDVRTLRGQS
jgi:hypothetical protein